MLEMVVLMKDVIFSDFNVVGTASKYLVALST